MSLHMSMRLTAPTSRLLTLLRHQASRCRGPDSAQNCNWRHQQSTGAVSAASPHTLACSTAAGVHTACRRPGREPPAADSLHRSMHSVQCRSSVMAAAGGSSADWQGVQQMGVAELKAILDDEDARDAVQLLDVREPWEAEEASLPAFTLLPLSRQQEWASDIAQQLDLGKHTIVLCHHGMRSNMVANFLVSEQIGFENVSNVVGGIDAYAALDPRTPRY